MNFKLVISDPKAKHAYNKEVEQTSTGLVGKRIGEVVGGEGFGMEGYKLEITGGSDKEGFPMRRDVAGMARKRILLASPPGFHPVYSGQRKRKSVRGNTLSADIAQVNLKIIEPGRKTLTDIFGSKEKAEAKVDKEAKGEKAPEQKAEKPKQEPETKQESKKEEPAK